MPQPEAMIMSDGQSSLARGDFKNIIGSCKQPLCEYVYFIRHGADHDSLYTCGILNAS